MHIILGLAGLVATLVATRNHMPTGFTGFFHPAALILLLGAPPRSCSSATTSPRSGAAS